MEELEARALLRGYAAAEETEVEGPRGGRPQSVQVTVLKAQRDIEPAVVEQRQKIATAYAYRKLVGVLFTNAERDANLVSRELTRRTGSYEAKPRRESRFRP